MTVKFRKAYMVEAMLEYKVLDSILSIMKISKLQKLVSQKRLIWMP